MPRTDFIGDLQIVYYTSSISLLENHHLQDASITIDELHAAAMKNVQRQKAKISNLEDMLWEMEGLPALQRNSSTDMYIVTTSCGHIWCFYCFKRQNFS